MAVDRQDARAVRTRFEQVLAGRCGADAAAPASHKGTPPEGPIIPRLAEPDGRIHPPRRGTTGRQIWQTRPGVPPDFSGQAAEIFAKEIPARNGLRGRALESRSDPDSRLGASQQSGQAARADPP